MIKHGTIFTFNQRLGIDFHPKDSFGIELQYQTFASMVRRKNKLNGFVDKGVVGQADVTELKQIPAPQMHSGNVTNFRHRPIVGRGMNANNNRGVDGNNNRRTDTNNNRRMDTNNNRNNNNNNRGNNSNNNSNSRNRPNRNGGGFQAGQKKKSQDTGNSVPYKRRYSPSSDTTSNDGQPTAYKYSRGYYARNSNNGKNNQSQQQPLPAITQMEVDPLPFHLESLAEFPRLSVGKLESQSNQNNGMSYACRVKTPPRVPTLEDGYVIYPKSVVWETPEYDPYRVFVEKNQFSWLMRRPKGYFRYALPDKAILKEPTVKFRIIGDDNKITLDHYYNYDDDDDFIVFESSDDPEDAIEDDSGDETDSDSDDEEEEQMQGISSDEDDADDHDDSMSGCTKDVNKDESSTADDNLKRSTKTVNIYKKKFYLKFFSFFFNFLIF
jgi:hypothetical protein